MIVALGIDLVVGQYGRKIVALEDEFFRLVMWTQFLHWDAEYCSGIWHKGKFLHFREIVNTGTGADF